MRCQVCRGKAAIEVRQHRAAFCPTCFVKYFQKQVKRNIQRYKMFSPGERVLLVVSGGKDSSSLWHALLELGYEVVALHVDLGIPGYSDRSRKACQDLADVLGSELRIVSVKEEFEMGIPELARKARRLACAICGRIKRYIFNRYAVEGGFTTVVTGHNLDDEVSALLGNLLHWQTGYLARQHPCLPSTHPRLARRVKPLYTLTERECLAYALIERLPFLDEECPHAEGATTILYKEALNLIEASSPGTKRAFMKGFLKHKDLFRTLEEGVELRECTRCGQVTTEVVCAVCRLRERVEAGLPDQGTSDEGR